MKMIAHEKYDIFYSPKYTLKSKKDRLAALEKVRDLISNPAKYNKSTSYGTAKYIENLTLLQKSGYIIKSPY